MLLTRKNRGNAFERWGQFRAERDMKTDTKLTNFVLSRQAASADISNFS